jgi:hypothetical protein
MLYKLQTNHQTEEPKKETELVNGHLSGKMEREKRSGQFSSENTSRVPTCDEEGDMDHVSPPR